MPFTIVRQDITKLKVDAIVNAANFRLADGRWCLRSNIQGGGVAQLQAACDKLAPIKTGEAIITQASISQQSLLSMRWVRFIGIGTMSRTSNASALPIQTR